LATDLVREEDQPKVVGLMYVMLLFGMVVSALVYGRLLENYTPGRLIQVIQGTAVLTIALNLFALWKQEALNRERAREMDRQRTVPFAEAWNALIAQPGMIRLMVLIALGTFGFGMADVLLEPYGGQALGFSVAETTRLTALFATGTLIGFAIASRVLSGPADAVSVGRVGALVGVPGFAAIILASFGGGALVFLAGVLATGLGAGLFGHATLTATIRAAPDNRIGLALGTWGAVQATAAGIGVALAGITRDIIVQMPVLGGVSPAAPYNYVFAIEIAFLVLAIALAIPRGRTTVSEGRETDSVEIS
ncbi:MAG: MFS transporter, partial [Paracoccaceae bacterium]|nr:MFS transporter [Paracoccaceae bacterium]